MSSAAHVGRVTNAQSGVSSPNSAPAGVASAVSPNEPVGAAFWSRLTAEEDRRVWNMRARGMSFPEIVAVLQKRRVAQAANWECALAEISHSVSRHCANCGRAFSYNAKRSKFTRCRDCRA